MGVEFEVLVISFQIDKRVFELNHFRMNLCRELG